HDATRIPDSCTAAGVGRRRSRLGSDRDGDQEGPLPEVQEGAGRREGPREGGPGVRGRRQGAEGRLDGRGARALQAGEGSLAEGVARMNVGVLMFVTERGLPVTELARACEERGLESLWVPEHPVVPARHETRYPLSDDGRLP